MLRHKKIIFLALLLGIIIILTSNRSNCKTTSGILIEPSSQVLENDEQVEIAVTLSNKEIAAYTIYVYYDTNKLEYISSPENSNQVDNVIIHTGVTSNGQNEKKILISPFIFKTLNQDAITSVIVTGEFYNQDGEKVEIEDEILEIQIGEKQEQEQLTDEITNTMQTVSLDKTNLRILRLDTEGISPNFSPDIKDYYIIVGTSISNIQVTAIPENSNANVEITGNTNLRDGLNVIKIVVESEDKTKTSEYIINVTKTDNIEKANANLETLAAREGDLNPEFDADTTKYKINLPSDIEQIDMLAVPENMNARVQIKKDNSLNVGDNLIEIIVTAEDGITTKKYQIEAHRRTIEEDTEYEKERVAQEKTLTRILEENGDKAEGKKVIYIVIGITLLTIVGIIIWFNKKKSTK